MLSERFWEVKHQKESTAWLTGARLQNYTRFFGVDPAGKRVLEIGCGMCIATKELAEVASDLWVVDVAPSALVRAHAYVGDKALHVREEIRLPSNYFDLVISYVVTQHLSDIKVVHQIGYALRSLKEDGQLAIQYMHKEGRSGQVNQRGGTKSRSPSQFSHMVVEAGGHIIRSVKPIDGLRHPGLKWHGYIIERGRQ